MYYRRGTVGGAELDTGAVYDACYSTEATACLSSRFPFSASKKVTAPQ